MGRVQQRHLLEEPHRVLVGPLAVAGQPLLVERLELPFPRQLKLSLRLALLRLLPLEPPLAGGDRVALRLLARSEALALQLLLALRLQLGLGRLEELLGLRREPPRLLLFLCGLRFGGIAREGDEQGEAAARCGHFETPPSKTASLVMTCSKSATDSS